MSHLKEPVVITFLADTLSNNAYELLFPAPYRFKFNKDLFGSYGWIPSTTSMTGDEVIYLIENKTTGSFIGEIKIYKSNAAIYFFSVDHVPVAVSQGDIIAVYSQATKNIGRFGISLVGER